ncbi:tyrosine-type recombinase/integrase [Neobacillus rhizophilus]|uniref:Tyrosine-type recombinase/integrase n=1 Tax=Neobacillus rhizophilus TaxID=2833579 RepID=A0A942YVZ8_9BACI|nr:tyrosine-type recombinase/integrase [Neobacillus rhizophilus]MBS4214589.1 tyrosine-type recombinase/integrase [Neobacillus rhizophilus]
MKVQPIITKQNKERYVLINGFGEVVVPVARFLKFKDNMSFARNTLRRYCYDLKLFFEFLEQKQCSYNEVNMDLLAEFVSWLQNPHQNTKVLSLKEVQESKRSARTINNCLNCILEFYDYLLKHEEFSLTINDKFKRQVSGNRSNYKSLLHHISKNKVNLVNTLKIKVPKQRLKILTPEQVETLLNACNNSRDKFLLYLLYETSMRIGEALSLRFSDIVPGLRKIHIKDRGEQENMAEIKTVNSERTIDCSQELINLYSSYVLEYHTEDVDTDFVFIKLHRENRNQPMTYTTVNGLFNNLKRKTGINITPHMFRHTSLTELWRTGEMRPETLKERAGHKHIQTTNIYIQVSEEDVREDWEKAVQKKKRGTNDVDR